MTDDASTAFGPTDWEIRRQAEALAREFAGVFGQETIARFMTESLDSLKGARTSEYVSLFAWRFSRERLLALAQAEGSIAKERPEILFVCVHNAGRSQMAAGYLQHLAGDRIDVLSAGSQPGDRINPVAVEAMAEEGIDIAAQQPKVLTPEAVQASDVVVTMGCGDECPYFPGKRYEDWVLDDPAGQGIEAVRPIRDEIRRRIERLVSELL
jgi:arsenate reductase